MLQNAIYLITCRMFSPWMIASQRASNLIFKITDADTYDHVMPTCFSILF